MRFVAVPLLVATAAFAGCLGFPDEGHTFHFAYVEATVTNPEPDTPSVCAAVAPDPAPEIDPHEQTLTLHGDSFDLDGLHGLVVAFITFEEFCPTQTVDVYPVYGSRSEVDVTMPGLRPSSPGATLGNAPKLHIEFQEEGGLVTRLDDEEPVTIAAGGSRDGEYRDAGPDVEYTVTAEGNWPSDGIVLEDGEGEPGGDDRSSSYVFAWITGNYTAHPPPGGEGYVGICGYPSEPEVNEQEQTLTFRSAGRDAFEGRDVVGLRGLVLLTQWDYSACGVLVTVVETVWTAEEPNVMIELLGDLTLGLRLNRDDGSVTLFQDETPEENAIQVEEGASHSGNYSGETEDGGTFEATYTLRALGHWPTTGIILGEEASEQPV